MTALPDGWKSRQIGELVEVLDGRRIPVLAKERALRAGSVPYYGATGQVGWIDRPIFNEELVLLGEDGVQFFDSAKQKAYRIVGPSWVNNHAHVLRVRPAEVDPRFLTHYLNQVDYRGLANGTTRLKLTQAAMRRINVAAPSLEEQRRIVDVLEDHLSRLAAGEGYLRASAVRTESLRSAWLATAPDLVSAKRFRIGDLLAEPLRHGRSVPTADTGFPVLRLTAIRNGRIDLAARKTGAWTRADAEQYLVVKGDFLVARGNGSLSLVGRGGLVVDDPDPIAYPDTAIRVRPRADRMDAQFLACVWNSREIRQQIERRARTTAGIYKINQADMRSLTVPVPDIDKQKQFALEAEAFEMAANRLAAAARTFESRSSVLRQSLLEAAFSGRLNGSSRDTEIVEELANV
jgi:type I restriction enzyme, S subunit